MSESYTPRELIDKINSENPNGPPYDPANTESLREASRINKATQGDIIAQAELQNRETQRQEATIIEAKIAQAEKVIADMREWLTQDGTYSSEQIDERLSKLTVEYDNDTDQAITSGTHNLRSLTSAEGLTLPESIGGTLDLSHLTSAEGLTLPQSVGGELYLGFLRSAEDLTFPQSVGGDLDLRELTSAEGLTLPQSVGGELYLPSLTSEDRQKLRELLPDLADKIVGI